MKVNGRKSVTCTPRENCTAFYAAHHLRRHPPARLTVVASSTKRERNAFHDSKTLLGVCAAVVGTMFGVVELWSTRMMGPRQRRRVRESTGVVCRRQGGGTTHRPHSNKSASRPHPSVCKAKRSTSEGVRRLLLLTVSFVTNQTRRPRKERK